jgi:putative transposase
MSTLPSVSLYFFISLSGREGLEIRRLERTLAMSYNHSHHAVYLLNYHFIFVPKYRKKWLVGRLRPRLFELIQDYALKYETWILALEIMSDHVHLFVSVKSFIAPSQIALYLKGWSSRILRQEFPFLQKYQALWSPSYFVCSSGNVSSETIRQYIEESQHL